MTVTENYFKALGYRYFNDPKNTVHPDGYWSRGEFFKEKFIVLPNITQSFPDFKKWVLEKMLGEGCTHTLGSNVWIWYRDDEPRIFIDEEIQNNEILEAAVIAATRYLESKK